MNDILKRILSQNWAFYTHRQLYAMVRTEAAGAGVLADADQAWTEFSALMADSRRRVAALLRAAGASWEGLAGESMRAEVTPLAQWAEDAETAGQASGGGLQQLGEAFSRTANAMPEPVEVAPSAGFPSKYVHLFGGLTDQDKQTRLAHEAKRHAVELMQRYSANAHSAVSSLGVFVPPREVAVRSGPFTLSGGAVVQQEGAVLTGAPVAGAPAAANGPANAQNPKGDSLSRAHRAGGSVRATTTGVAGQAPASAAAGTLPASLGAQRAGEVSRNGGSAERLAGPPGPGLTAGPGGRGRNAGRSVAADQQRAGTRVTARLAPGMLPANAAKREEDREHVSPEYLVIDRDDVWDGVTASPPVIGED